jgi:putative FmdB family regulatory protein
MPIYEYECTRCGRVEEIFQKFSDKPLNKCKICSGKLQKLISHSSFHLKGTGWYATDYANKSSSSNPVSKKTGESKTANKETSSSKDNKPEATSAPSSQPDTH